MNSVQKGYLILLGLLLSLITLGFYYPIAWLIISNVVLSLIVLMAAIMLYGVYTILGDKP